MNKYSKNKIAALILAAGAGGRIGKPKWQLEFEGKTFLEILCDKLSAVQLQLTDVICVKRKEFGIKNSLLKHVINPTPEYGMISSLYYGVKAYPNYDAYLIWPVDHPFVEISTISELKKAFETSHRKVIRPIFKGTPGHPIILPKAVAEKMLSPNFDGGLRNFIKQYDVKIADITVDDENILKNINTTADLERIIGLI